MASRVRIGDMDVDVVFKDVKNVHLSVHPPSGAVRVTAPERMTLDTVRVFALAKRDWIKRQQRTLREQRRETPREYLERESHDVWGRRYLLHITEKDAAPMVELRHRTLWLQVRPGTDGAGRQTVVEGWYREQIKRAVPALLTHWEPIVGAKAQHVFVRRMKTKWGSCNPVSGNIRLNTDLAKKPRVCLEYVLVHELVHLLEPTHNARFVELMDRLMPNWAVHRAVLNSLPLRHEQWGVYMD